MKKQLFILIVLIISVLRVQATVRTVSNHPSGGAQYSTLAAAYAAASNGDTLILEGTDITYQPNFGTGVAWAKSLVVIGAGFNPETSSGKNSRISSSGGYTVLFMSSGSSGSKFYGIEFTNAFDITESTSNIVFEDCKFNYYFDLTSVSFTNVTFYNCIIDYDSYDFFTSNGSTVASLTFMNCVFDCAIDGGNYPSIVLTFDHCIFLKTSGYVFNNVVSPIVLSSIFMNVSTVANSYTTGGTFNNNIARLASVLPPVGCGGSGNITLTDPLFTTYTLGSYYSNSFDFALQAASPGNDAGADGTDIGVHGGASTFSETGEPLIIPVIRSMTVSTAAVESGGTINITVTAGKPNVD